MENNEPIPAANGASSMDTPHNDAPKLSQADYLAAAQSACASGDDVLGMHLYLAAFETQSQDSFPPTSETLNALRCAWKLAISLKERSIAEYIFEKLEPFISAQEMGECADALQQLALDRLEEFGLPREELEQMAEAFSEDFFTSNIGESSIHIEQFTIPSQSFSFGRTQESAPSLEESNDNTEEVPDSSDILDSITKEAPVSNGDLIEISDAAITSGDQAEDAINVQLADGSFTISLDTPASSPEQPPAKAAADHEKFADLVGFDEAISDMRSLGIGVGDDAEFKAFIEQLNAFHGVDRMPSIDSLIFSAVAREDANRFLDATLHEIGLPVIRMSFEESLQGIPMLVVASEGVDFRGRQNFMRLGFTQPMSLVLENIDLWSLPDGEILEDKEAAAIQSGALRGAREALNIIRSAVMNPSVYVLSSTSSLKDVDPFFLDMLAPATIVEINLPTEEDRRAIWTKVLDEHNSIGQVDIDDLVRLSDGMPRYDIESAAHEAIDEAYKQSLIKRRYIAVSPQNIFEKLATYQPLGSELYRDLEEKVIDDFRRDLAHINDILNEDN